MFRSSKITVADKQLCPRIEVKKISEILRLSVFFLFLKSYYKLQYITLQYSNPNRLLTSNFKNTGHARDVA